MSASSQFSNLAAAPEALATPADALDVLAPPPAPAAAAVNAHMPRLPMLDGWRAISIFTVLVCHLGYYDFPQGQINQPFGIFGMAVFFCLSGFLITSTLYFDPNVRVFVIRRFFRIVPLVWLFLLVTLPFEHVSKRFWLANLLFNVNHAPFYINAFNGHLWSLSVEVQFYVGIAVLFALLRQRAFPLLPVLGLAVTAARVFTHTTFNIRTELRVDEILAGATLAYLFHSPWAHRLRAVLARIPPLLPLLLLCGASSIWTVLARLEYLRPWLAALLVGTTLCQPSGWWSRWLSSRPLAYLAAISYAVYIWHPLIGLGARESTNRFIVLICSQPLGLLLLWAVAHCSTFYFEKRAIAVGKRLASRVVST